MPKQIYELNWLLVSDTIETIRSEWRVFSSKESAGEYGVEKQRELNSGLSPDEKAWDGYCFRFLNTRAVGKVDGYRILVKPMKVNQLSKKIKAG